MCKNKSSIIIQLIFACQLWKSQAALAGDEQCTEKKSEHGVTLSNSKYKNFTVADTFTCVNMCNADKRCFSLNFDRTKRTCELNSATKATYPQGFTQKPESTYMESIVRTPGLRHCSLCHGYRWRSV